MKKNYHEIVCIIDRSDSMNDIKSEAIAGFNSFIKAQKEFQGETTLSLILFNQEYQSVYERRDINEVPLLDDSTYLPKGATAILDAIGISVDRLGEKLYQAPEDKRPEKVIVAILTDGLENASGEYTYEQVADKVREQQAMYNWEFVLLAANQDAVVTGDKIGIKREDAVNFKATSQGITTAFEDMNKIVFKKRSK